MNHPDLWTAPREQLIEKYTTDPKTSGYGIYLVLWHDENGTPKPLDGTPRPTTPETLKQHLVNSLAADETRKIRIIALDVTPPQS